MIAGLIALCVTSCTFSLKSVDEDQKDEYLRLELWKKDKFDVSFLYPLFMTRQI